MPLFSANKLVASIATSHIYTGMVPDTCKTPAPPAPAPVPIPYPNIATTATPGPGYSTKTMAFGTPAYTKNSAMGVSNGMNAGVALGIVSNKIMGLVHAVAGSSDVTIEGGDVMRTLDSASSNG